MTFVTAIVVTYRRHDQLLSTLSGVLGQTRPPDRVIVVDNESSEVVETRMAALDGPVEYVDSGDNLGPGGGFAVGLASAATSSNDWYWIPRYSEGE